MNVKTFFKNYKNILLLTLTVGVGCFNPLIGIIMCLILFWTSNATKLNFTDEEKMMLNIVFILLLIYLSVNVAYQYRYLPVEAPASEASL
ncbi:MAG: hypothetical protein ACOX3C_02175 [Bacilli bacterium]|jgi:hypothetical protein